MVDLIGIASARVEVKNFTDVVGGTSSVVVQYSIQFFTADVLANSSSIASQIVFDRLEAAVSAGNFTAVLQQYAQQLNSTSLVPAVSLPGDLRFTSSYAVFQHSAWPTSSPSSQPAAAPSSQPSGQPTSAPTFTQTTQWIHRFERELKTLFPAKRSEDLAFFYEMEAEGRMLYGGSDAWATFVSIDLSLLASAKRPIGISYTSINDSTVPGITYTCDESDAVKQLTDALTSELQPSTYDNRQSEVLCNRRIWSVAYCVGAQPSLCVDCPLFPCGSSGSRRALSTDDSELCVSEIDRYSLPSLQNCFLGTGHIKLLSVEFEIVVKGGVFVAYSFVSLWVTILVMAAWSEWKFRGVSKVAPKKQPKKSILNTVATPAVISEVKTALVAKVESLFARCYYDGSHWSRLAEVMLRYHQYIQPFTTPQAVPRYANVLLLATRVTMLMFVVQIILYSEFPFDVHRCEQQVDQSSCLSLRSSSFLDPQSMCVWSPRNDTAAPASVVTLSPSEYETQCFFANPDITIFHMVRIVVIALLFVLWFRICVLEFLVHKVILAPTLDTAKPQFLTSGSSKSNRILPFDGLSSSSKKAVVSRRVAPDSPAEAPPPSNLSSVKLEVSTKSVPGREVLEDIEEVDWEEYELEIGGGAGGEGGGTVSEGKQNEGSPSPLKVRKRLPPVEFPSGRIQAMIAENTQRGLSPVMSLQQRTMNFNIDDDEMEDYEIELRSESLVGPSDGQLVIKIVPKEAVFDNSVTLGKLFRSVVTLRHAMRPVCSLDDIALFEQRWALDPNILAHRPDAVLYRDLYWRLAHHWQYLQTAEQFFLESVEQTHQTSEALNRELASLPLMARYRKIENDLLLEFAVDLIGRHALEARVFREANSDAHSTKVAVAAVPKWLQQLCWLLLVGLNVFLILFCAYLGHHQSTSWCHSWSFTFVIAIVLDAFYLELSEKVWFFQVMPQVTWRSFDTVRNKLLQCVEAINESYFTAGSTKSQAEETEEQEEGGSSYSKRFKDPRDFNACESLFVSYQVAQANSSLIESKVVLHYKSYVPGNVVNFEWSYRRDSDARGGIAAALALLPSVAECAVFLRSCVLMFASFPTPLQRLFISATEVAVLWGVLVTQSQGFSFTGIWVYGLVLFLLLVLLVSVHLYTKHSAAIHQYVTRGGSEKVAPVDPRRQRSKTSRGDHTVLPQHLRHSHSQPSPSAAGQSTSGVARVRSGSEHSSSHHSRSRRSLFSLSEDEEEQEEHSDLDDQTYLSERGGLGLGSSSTSLRRTSDQPSLGERLAVGFADDSEDEDSEDQRYAGMQDDEESVLAAQSVVSEGLKTLASMESSVVVSTPYASYSVSKKLLAASKKFTPLNEEEEQQHLESTVDALYRSAKMNRTVKSGGVTGGLSVASMDESVMRLHEISDSSDEADDGDSLTHV